MTVPDQAADAAAHTDEAVTRLSPIIDQTAPSSTAHAAMQAIYETRNAQAAIQRITAYLGARDAGLAHVPPIGPGVIVGWPRTDDDADGEFELTATDLRTVLDALADAQQRVDDFDAAFDDMTPQICAAGIHGAWAADSEYVHACPWCQIERFEAEREEQRARADAAVKRIAELERENEHLRSQLNDDMERDAARVLELDEQRAYADRVVAETDRLREAWQQAWAERNEARSQVADYENRITWHTTCKQCAATLDASTRETERAEKAEARIRELEAERDDLQPEWQIQYPDQLGTGQTHSADFDVEEHARYFAAQYDGAVVYTRLIGPWHDANPMARIRDHDNDKTGA